MNETEVRKVLNRTGEHNHPVRRGAKWTEIVLEKDCPRCKKIEELLRELREGEAWAK